MQNADYIIVGAGSAGCVLASRLSEDASKRVLIIEHGGTDAGPFIQMPAALSYPMNMKRYDWGYRTEPEPHLGGRRLVCPRGKVIGGSSSINGMVYVRGHACDYDHWAESGADGWSYADVLPYFQRMETSHGGQEGWRGTNGPLHVTRGEMTNPLFNAFIQSGQEAGFPFTADYNGEQQEGFGPMERTVWKGRRWSAANAYLKPALKRPNLQLERALVRRVLFDGTRACGVEVERNGRIESINTSGEVILSASAINSPKILQLSGIGDAEHLQGLGIDIVRHLPGVGRNLMDHLELYIQYECLQPITLNGSMSLFHKAMIGAQWLLTGQGLGASNHFEAAAFIRSRAGIRYPDIQYHFLPAAVRYDGTSPSDGHGFQVHVGPMRSESRGEVMVRTADPRDDPRIQFNYMSQEQDWIDFRHCIRISRHILRQQAMEPYIGRELAPGDDRESNEALDDYIREHVESAYHPCGTCRMGSAENPESVVDPECRVVGTDNLRVVDCSVFPRITNGNLNGPTLVTAEKAADHIAGKPGLARSNLQPWIHPDWETTDRLTPQ